MLHITTEHTETKYNYTRKTSISTLAIHNTKALALQMQQKEDGSHLQKRLCTQVRMYNLPKGQPVSGCLSHINLILFVLNWLPGYL